MSYALKRGTDWICAPDGQGTGQILPPVLAVGPNRSDAWLAPDLDTALERSALLRTCWGWSTQVRAIR